MYSALISVLLATSHDMYRHLLLLYLFIIQIIGWSCATYKSPPLSPIVSYETNDGLVTHLTAVIKKSNLDHGTGVSKDARDRLKPFRLDGDDTGHLIGKRLGGTGKKDYNLIPQNLGVNRGPFRVMEDKISKAVDKTGPVRIDSELKYESNFPRRPSAIDVTAKRHDGSLLLHQSFSNDKYNKPYKPGLSKSLPDLSQIGTSSSNTQRKTQISQSPGISRSHPNINRIGSSSSNSNTRKKRQRTMSKGPSTSGRGRGGFRKFSSRRRS